MLTKSNNTVPNFTPITDIDTFGWDIVYLSSLKNVNSAIEKLNAGPTTISQQMSASVGIGVPAKTFKLNANWNPWKFTWTGSSSSSGYIAQCEISFKDSAPADLEEWDATNTQSALNTYSLKGGKTVIQFYLAYYDTVSGNHFTNPNMIGGKQRDLCIRAAGQDPDNLPTSIKNSPFFSIVSSRSTWQECSGLVNLDQGTKTLLSGFVDQLIKNWLGDSANSNDITQVFASLNVASVLSQEADSKGLKPLEWMLPNQVDYCIANVVDHNTGSFDLNKSMIACMAMAEEHHSTNWNSSQVDESILTRLTDTANSALVISRRMFVEHFLLPAIKEFPKDKDTVRWQFANTGDTILNQNTVNMGHLPNKDGNDAAATVGPNKFSFGVRNDEIHMEIQDITWKWSDEYECAASYFVSYKLELDITDKLNPKLRVTQGSVDNCSVTVTNIGNDTGKILTDALIGVVGGLFGAAIGGAIGAKLGEVIAARAAADALANGAPIAYDFTGVLTARLGAVGAVAAEDTVLDATWNATQKLGIYVTEALRGGAYKVGNLLDLCFESKAKALGALIGAVAGVAPAAIMAAAEYTNAELQNDLGKLPNFTSTVQVGLASVKWPTAPTGEEGFELNEVILDGALILGGKIIEGQ